MTIYAFPDIDPVETSWSLVANTKTFQSPLSSAVQTIARNAAFWSITLRFDLYDEDERRELIGFIALLNGQEHRFSYSDTTNVYGGTGNGTPKVVGASGSGRSLATDGWANSETVMKRGDMFGVNSELKMCTSNVISNGSGQATINFVPELRQSPADNADIDLSAPTGVFMLMGDVVWSNRTGPFSSLTITAMEDVLATL